MKLTGVLKEKVEQAKTVEEGKGAIKDAGIELTDEEFEQVTGGIALMPEYASSRKANPFK